MLLWCLSCSANPHRLEQGCLCQISSVYNNAIQVTINRRRLRYSSPLYWCYWIFKTINYHITKEKNNKRTDRPTRKLLRISVRYRQQQRLSKKLIVNCLLPPSLSRNIADSRWNPPILGGGGGSFSSLATKQYLAEGEPNLGSHVVFAWGRRWSRVDFANTTLTLCCRHQ